MAPRAGRILLLGALTAAAPGVHAQEGAERTPPRQAERSVAATVAMTGGLILAGATGAQAIQTPKAWSRTGAGFGYRVADQTGFYVVQASTLHAVGRALGYRQDAASCRGASLLGCSVTSTFTAFDRTGRRRLNAPLVTSLLIGTGTSLLWRPERHVNGEAWAFVGTRLGITVGGYVAERLLVEWWGARRPSARPAADATARARLSR